jgi:hypothetical protein
MANTFTRKMSQSVGTTATRVGSYTVPAATATTIIGLSVANRTGSQVFANVFVSDNAVTNTYVVYNAPIPAGGALVAVGGDQKIVLTNGDGIFVQSSAASSIDAILSVLEVS